MIIINAGASHSSKRLITEKNETAISRDNFIFGLLFKCFFSNWREKAALPDFKNYRSRSYAARRTDEIYRGNRRRI